MMNKKYPELFGFESSTLNESGEKQTAYVIVHTPAEECDFQPPSAQGGPIMKPILPRSLSDIFNGLQHIVNIRGPKSETILLKSYREIDHLQFVNTKKNRWSNPGVFSYYFESVMLQEMCRFLLKQASKNGDWTDREYVVAAYLFMITTEYSPTTVVLEDEWLPHVLDKYVDQFWGKEIREYSNKANISNGKQDIDVIIKNRREGKDGLYNSEHRFFSYSRSRFLDITTIQYYTNALTRIPLTV